MMILALLLAGCSTSERATPEGRGGELEPSAGPAATGRVIEIRAISDERGNRFEPMEIEARQGDVLRVVLLSGVHNLHFLPDSNPGAANLPAPTDMLQLPGQTVDVPISFGRGHYFFQCDPHAALGMTGKLEIED
jgi:plastocyanin